jgi:hypothetical protein
MTLVLMTGVFAHAAQPSAAAPAVAKVSSDFGIQTTTFDTVNGTVTVVTPSLMQTGDRITGTVLVEPTGACKADRDKNRDVLNGMVVDVMGEKVGAGKGIFSVVVPAIGAVALLGSDGKPSWQAPIATLPKGSFEPQPPNPTRYDFALPAVSTLGKPLAIQGVFDGDLQNTSVKLDGQPASIIAESPRMTVVQSPLTGTGVQKVEITNQRGTVTGQINVVRVTLSARKMTLRNKESTEITARVEGLRGLAKTAFPVPLTLQNESPGTIQLQGGNTQTHQIAEAETNSGGNFTLKTNATATRVGTFAVNARIVAPGNVYSYPGGWSSGWWGDDRDTPIDMDGVDTIAQLDNYSVRRLMDTLRDLRQRKRWDYVQGRAHQKWLAKKIRLVKAALGQRGVPVPGLPIDDPDF